MMLDALIVALVPLVALLIRFEGTVDTNYYQLIFNYLPSIICIRLITFYVFGLYHRLWRYASVHELVLIVSAVTVSSIIFVVYIYVIGESIPRSIHLISWLLNIIFIGASRLILRISSYIHQRRNLNSARVLIVGAGDAGAMIAREIRQRYYKTKQIIGFIDDDVYKQSKLLFGAKVLAPTADIKNIVDSYNINEIIIAIPSLAGNELRSIVQDCKATKCEVKILPGIYELIDGKVTVQQLRKVELEDLLRREPVKLDVEQIANYLKDKRVLVTGAGGSIGSELCRQIAEMQPASLVLLGKGENSIYEIERELREKYANVEITPIIADVRDYERIEGIFATVKPQVVFHAAAHKHVPLMEAQPVEAVRNNIFGTKNVAAAANCYGVEIFVMISTDKAVNPTSVMGATKRVAELVIQSMKNKGKTKFVAVRFGNVLGSRGSVVPLFKRQIEKGGPLTITHPEMQRYFMTIPEASQLVLQAGALAKGGEVFVLDMGEPVKIVDMACDLIELSGLVPHKDIEINYTGLRPGEKLFEELLTAEEGTSSTKHEKIYVANLKDVNQQRLAQGLAMLKGTDSAEELIKIMSSLIPTYKCERLQQCAAATKTNIIIDKEQFNEENRQYQSAVNCIQ